MTNTAVSQDLQLASHTRLHDFIYLYFIYYATFYIILLFKYFLLFTYLYPSGFDSRRYQRFWEVLGFERGTLSLVSTIKELLERKSSGSGLEIRKYGSRDPSRWPRGTLYLQTLTLTSPTSGGHSVGIVRSQTQATEFSLV
jgi:hypothetical protein